MYIPEKSQSTFTLKKTIGEQPYNAVMTEVILQNVSDGKTEKVKAEFEKLCNVIKTLMEEEEK